MVVTLSEGVKHLSTSALSDNLPDNQPFFSGCQLSENGEKGVKMPRQRSDEKQTEKYLKYRCDKNGWGCFKQSVVNKRGWPDRTVFCAGTRTYYIECKDRGKRPRPDQVAIHEMLRKLGHVVLLIDSKEKVKQFEFYAFHAIPIPADSNLTYPEQSSRAKSRRGGGVPGHGPG